VAAGREPSVAAPAPFRVPASSADVIAARGGQGTVFSADQFGGYLAWRLGPGWRPWIDTRLVLRTPDEFAEYLAVVDDPLRFDAWERAHAIDYVLLPIGYPDRYLALVAHLHASARWRLVHTSGSEVLFARAGATSPADAVDLGAAATVDELLADIDARFGDAALADAARVQLATLELAVGEQAQAERVLARAGGDAADALRARARFAAGDLDGAERLARATLARRPDDVATLDLLAAIAARRGEHAAALAYLRGALLTDAFDGEANRMLDTWEANARTTK
jgi:tetratricopeptide (TPR) repeat protein